jgi:hypothetical protein
MAILFQGCVYKNEQNYSTKVLNLGEQKVFNIAKKMFLFDDSKEFIIDTTWNSLIASKRENVYYPFNIKLKETVYKLDINSTSSEMKFNLEIYTQVGKGEKRYLEKDDYQHQLFWNRIEYALGGTRWLTCTNIKYYNNFLCNIDPENLRK